MKLSDAQIEAINAVYDNATANRIVFYGATGNVISEENRAEFHPFRDAFKVDLPSGCERYDVCNGETPLWTRFIPRPASPQVPDISSLEIANTEGSGSDAELPQVDNDDRCT